MQDFLPQKAPVPNKNVATNPKVLHNRGWRSRGEAALPRRRRDQHIGSADGTVPLIRKLSTARFTHEFDLLYAVCPSPS